MCMSQYSLPLPLDSVFLSGNFVVSGCNDLAHRWITRWPDWPANALYIYGPHGCGKTHLAHIWAEKTGAQFLLDRLDATLSEQGNPALILENIEQSGNEAALFHLLNHTKQLHRPLLITSSFSAASLPFTLPDLLSRLKSLPNAEIFAPDDIALAAVLRKLFADRQLKVEAGVINYLLARSERSFSAASELVTRLDSAALAEKKALTIHFVRTFFAN